MKKQVILGVTLLMCLVTGSACFAASYYSSGWGISGSRYFVTYGEAKNYNWETLEAITMEHNRTSSGPDWHVINSTPDGIEVFLEIKIIDDDENDISDTNGNPYLMTAYWSSAAGSCESQEYQIVFVEPIFEAPTKVCYTEDNCSYSSTGKVIYDGEVLDTRTTFGQSAELAEMNTRSMLLNERYPRGCTIYQVHFEQPVDSKGDVYPSPAPFPGAVPGIDLDGAAVSLGGHYYYKRSSMIFRPDLLSTTTSSGKWDMGYGWQGDFNIRVGKTHFGKETIILEMRGKQYFFYKQPGGGYVSKYTGDARLQILDNETKLLIRLGDTAYEFDMPEETLAALPESECTQFDYPRPDVSDIDCQAGYRPVNKTTRIVTEQVDDNGIYSYQGFSLNYTYTGGLLREIVQPDTGEKYTFYYDDNNLLSRVTNNAGEDQFVFTYNPTTDNLATRWQKGYGTTTFRYFEPQTSEEAAWKWEHLLVGIDRPGEVTTEYDIKGTISYLSYLDELRAESRLVAYRQKETPFSGPQVEDQYLIPDDGQPYIEYDYPLLDDPDPLSADDYTYSYAIYPLQVDHDQYGSVTKRGYQDQKGALIVSYDDEGKTLYSQVVGTTRDENGNPVADGTVKTTINEWDDNGNLERTVTRDLEEIPENTWDVEYVYDDYNRIKEVKGLDGVTQIINYLPNSVSASMIASKWTVKDGVIINKTAYEYYPGDSPAHQRFRLHKKQLLDGETVIAEEVFDYVEQNDFPQNIGKLWKVTYYGGSSDDSALADSYEEYTYNQNGLESFRNRNGGVESYVRDDLGRVETFTSASHAVTGFTYYDHGRLWTTTLPSGGTITYHYDDQKRRTGADYPDNSTDAITYRVGNLVETTTSRMGLVSTYHYYTPTPEVVVIDGETYTLDGGNPDGSLAAITTPDGILASYTYDGLGRVKTTTDARGLEVTLKYDDYGRQDETTYPDNTFTKKVYYNEKHGRPLNTFQDRMGAVTTFYYDGFSRQTARVLPNDLREEFGYDNLSRLVKRTVKGTVQGVAKELVTDYAPDLEHPLNFEGMPTKITYPDGAFELFQYENGLLRFKTDRAGKEWEYSYTQAGRPHQVISLPGTSQETVVSDIDYIPAERSNAGQVEQIISAEGVTRRFEYDNMGRLKKTFMLDDNDNFVQISEIEEYKPAGPVSVRDRGGIITQRDYDEYGRLLWQAEPDNVGRKTIYTYYLAGDLKTITDAGNNVTTMLYDTEGRLKEKKYNDTSKYTYQYIYGTYNNKKALFVHQTDPKHQNTTTKTTTIYNKLGQLVAVDYPYDQDIAYNYNEFGALDDMTDASGTTTWAYDDHMRLTSEDGPFADNDVVGYGYDDTEPGKRLSALTLNSSNLVNYTDYDPLGRFKEVNGFTFSYINQSSLLDKIYRDDDVNKVVVDKDYDTFGRLKSVTNTLTDGTIVNSYGYTLDDSDRRDRVTFMDDSYIEYGQDSAGRLTSAKAYNSDGIKLPSYDYGFGYDRVGNPLSRTADNINDTYTFNDLNQPNPDTAENTVTVSGKVSPPIVNPRVKVNDIDASVDQEGYWVVNGVPVTEGTNDIHIVANDRYYREVEQDITVDIEPHPSLFYHDKNGNMETDGMYTYKWNDANRLSYVEPVNVVKDSKKQEFVYDGFGRRRVKKVYTWSGSSWTPTDVQRFVYNGFKQVAELDGSNVVRRQYSWLGDRLLSVSQDGATYYPTIDGNKNITAYVNASSGEVVAQYRYSPFGKIVEQSGDKADDFTFRFSSEAYDRETGQVYYNYRYYNPAFGRWLNRDPIGESGGINLYAMAGNNPVDNVDQLGLIFSLPLLGEKIASKANEIFNDIKEFPADIGRVCNQIELEEHQKIQHNLATGSGAVESFDFFTDEIAELVVAYYSWPVALTAGAIKIVGGKVLKETGEEILEKGLKEVGEVIQDVAVRKGEKMITQATITRALRRKNNPITQWAAKIIERSPRILKQIEELERKGAVEMADHIRRTEPHVRLDFWDFAGFANELRAQASDWPFNIIQFGVVNIKDADDAAGVLIHDLTHIIEQKICRTNPARFKYEVEAFKRQRDAGFNPFAEAEGDFDIEKITNKMIFNYVRKKYPDHFIAWRKERMI